MLSKPRVTRPAGRSVVRSRPCIGHVAQGTHHIPYFHSERRFREREREKGERLTDRQGERERERERGREREDRGRRLRKKAVRPRPLPPHLPPPSHRRPHTAAELPRSRPAPRQGRHFERSIRPSIGLRTLRSPSLQPPPAPWKPLRERETERERECWRSAERQRQQLDIRQRTRMGNVEGNVRTAKKTSMKRRRGGVKRR